MKKIIIPLAMIVVLFASITLCHATGTYSEGLAVNQQGSLWGYVNASGQVAISHQFDSAQSFSLGMAQVSQNGNVGIIRPDGTYLLSPIYQSLTYLGGGFYLAQMDHTFGVVNILSFESEGVATNIAYPFQYTNATLSVVGGIEVLTLYQGTTKTVIPKFQFTTLATTLGIEGAQFPLIEGTTANFSDVSAQDWYAGWVNISYNLGLMEGTGSNLFEPSATVTMAQILMLAANVESIYTGDDFHSTSVTSDTWYQPAVDYCLTIGIVTSSQIDDVNRAVTRAEVAEILGATTLAKNLPILNNLSTVVSVVPDVSTATQGATEIYQLYATGILSGMDSTFTFSPDTNITRAEVAAMVSRMARPEQRISLW